MQDKRRRNDFASTEVGEATGGRVTQQAFDEKDSGISNAAMPGTRGDGRKEAHDPDPFSKGASLHSLPSGPSLVSGLSGQPGKTSSKQAQGFNFQLPPPALARASRFEQQQSSMRQQRRSIWRCNNSAGFNEQEGSSTAGTGMIPLYSVQREASRKAASTQPTPPPSHLAVALAVSQACLREREQGAPTEPPNPVGSG